MRGRTADQLEASQKEVRRLVDVVAEAIGGELSSRMDISGPRPASAATSCFEPSTTRRDRSALDQRTRDTGPTRPGCSSPEPPATAPSICGMPPAANRGPAVLPSGHL
jgi:hypothetical protein